MRSISDIVTETKSQLIVLQRVNVLMLREESLKRRVLWKKKEVSLTHVLELLLNSTSQQKHA